MAKKFSIEAIFSATDKLVAPLGRIKSKLEKFGRDASKSLASFDQRLGAVHAGLSRIAGATAAVGAVGAAAAFAIGKTGAEFEQAITAVGAVSLVSRDQIADLEAKAKELGRTTKFTATQAANAMELMAMAGFSNADILKGIGPVLDAAAASGLEIAEVANHVSNALKGMGLETSEAGRVADVLAVASARTNSSIGSLGEALSGVASTARQFKIPLEDTVAGLALLQDVGLDASVAGSALNTMLTQMAKPTDEVAAKMKQFGVRFKDAKGNMLPFAEVLANISKAAKKSGGNMDQVAFIADLVGLRGQKAAANLKDLFDTGRVQQLTTELQNAAGAAKKMAAIRMDNTIGDLTLLESAVDGVKVALFETQSGPLRGMIQSMTQWVEKNKDLIVFEFQVWLRRIQDHLPEIVTWLERIGKAVVAFYALWAAVKLARLAVFAYQVALKLVTLATWAWQAAQWVATAAQTAYAAAVGASTGALAAFKVRALASAGAIGGQVTALAPLLVTLGAVTAAVMALYFAWDQYNKLDKDLAGSGGISGTVSKMIDMGTWDPFKAHDAVMNEKAIAERRRADQAAAKGAPGLDADWASAMNEELADAMHRAGVGADVAAAMNEELTKAMRQAGPALGADVASAMNEGFADAMRRSDGARPRIISPQERAATATAEAVAGEGARVDGRIVVEAKPGTKASVKQKPSRVPLELKPSGAFP